MPLLRRLAWAGFLWLTAISTVVAGMPHFVCHCPNGKTHKLLAFSTCKMGGCCCAASVGREKDMSARPAPQSQPKKRSCCSDTEERAAKTETGGESARCPNCLQSVEQADAQALPVTEDVPGDADSVMTLAWHEATFASFLVSAETTASRWEPYRIPPPLDLITVLQRLTI